MAVEQKHMVLVAELMVIMVVTFLLDLLPALVVVVAVALVLTVTPVHLERLVMVALVQPMLSKQVLI